MRARLTRNLPLVMGIACVALHLATVRGYGYHREELYSLACAKHLAWGYVDHPPLSVALLGVMRALFGDSLLALRFLPALAGGVTVFLTGALCRRMGGGAWAQALAMLPVIVAPAYLFQRHVYGPQVLDVLIWTLAAVVLARLFVTGERALWVVLGVVLGLGLINRMGVLWLGFGLAIGLRFSRHRGWYMTPWPWVAGALSLAIFAPHVSWQVRNDWPTLQLIRGIVAGTMGARSPLELVVRQMVEMNPVTLLVWGSGLAFLLLPGEARSFRPFAIVFLTVLALLAAFPSSRPSDLAPAYPPLFAAGGVALERWSGRPRRRLLAPAGLSLVALGGIVLAPAALPLLPIDAYVRYATALRLNGPGELPGRFADMFGWKEMAGALARARDALPTADRAQAELFVESYGEAAAVDFFGPELGLPRATCGHNSYWYWGPSTSSGAVVIVLGVNTENLLVHCASVEEAGKTDLPIRICRDLRPTLAALWPRLRHFD